MIGTLATYNLIFQFGLSHFIHLLMDQAQLKVFQI